MEVLSRSCLIVQINISSSLPKGLVAGSGQYLTLGLELAHLHESVDGSIRL